MRFINRATSGTRMPTIAACIQLLAAPMTTTPYRSTDGMAFGVIEGEGETEIADVRFAWKRPDVLVASSWHRTVYRPNRRATPFSFSDRSVQEALGIWREASSTTGDDA